MMVSEYCDDDYLIMMAMVTVSYHTVYYISSCNNSALEPSLASK